MKNQFKPIAVFILAIALFNSSPTSAQSTVQEENQILLSGKVICTNPINIVLSSVVVYNLNREHGTMTDKNGKYTIQMGVNDTIIFSTAQHTEYLYFLDEDEDFEDRIFDVKLETDEVWLSTVNIIGITSLEQFKQEIINFDLPKENIELTSLPIVKKYIKLTPLNAAEFDLEGPLTYLHKKFSKHYKIKKGIK